MKPLPRKKVVFRRKNKSRSFFNASVNYKRQIGTLRPNNLELARQLHTSQQKVKDLEGKNLILQRTIKLQIPKVVQANLSKMVDHLKFYLAIVQQTMQFCQNSDADIDMDATILNPDIDLSSMRPPNATTKFKQGNTNSKKITPSSVKRRSKLPDLTPMDESPVNDMQKETSEKENPDPDNISDDDYEYYAEKSGYKESSNHEPNNLEDTLVQKTRTSPRKPDNFSQSNPVQKTRVSPRKLKAIVVLDKINNGYKPGSDESSTDEEVMESNNGPSRTTRTSLRKRVPKPPQSALNQTKRRLFSDHKSAQRKILVDREIIEPSFSLDDDKSTDKESSENEFIDLKDRPVQKTRTSPRKLDVNFSQSHPELSDTLVQKTRTSLRKLNAVVALDKINDQYKPSSDENSNDEKEMESNNGRKPTTRTSQRKLVTNTPQPASKGKLLRRRKSAQSKTLVDNDLILESSSSSDDDESKAPPSRPGTNQVDAVNRSTNFSVSPEANPVTPILSTSLRNGVVSQKRTRVEYRTTSESSSETESEGDRDSDYMARKREKKKQLKTFANLNNSSSEDSDEKRLVYKDDLDRDFAPRQNVGGTRTRPKFSYQTYIKNMKMRRPN